MTLALANPTEPSAAVAPAPAVTYVVSRWGAPTETFVRREADAVRGCGAVVRALSMKRPGAAGTGVPTTALGPAALAGRALVAAVRHPAATTRVIARVLAGANARTIGPRLAAAAVGLAWTTVPEARADLLHVHFGWVSATAAWAATRVTGQPYSVVLHAFELHTPRRQDRFAEVPLRDAAQVFTISERDRALVAQRWGIRAEVLHMGVGDEWLAEQPLGLDAREPHTVVAVGSLVPKKGHDVLIDAIARTREPWSLDIIGEGPARRSLAQRIDALGLSDRVRLLGSVPEAEVRNRLRRAAVAALACVVAPDGDRDGIPVALMEAMACGTPVVSTRVSGIPELVGNGGLLVEPGDPSALARALDALADPALRRAMGARARERVVAEFRVSRSAERVVALAGGA